MSHKLGICIPYRNRKEHLDNLVPHLTKHLNKQGIKHHFYVAHQVDDKLFNRGAMKNIAAKKAFEDGCDYIAWHDVDMLPLDECDYSYPENNPIHIATKLSKYNYGLGYDQYFGGVVLFTKEQVEKTNGYSNEYWDWGQEDDDLFWRCYLEKYTTGKNIMNYENKKTYYFNGNNSSIIIPTNREISTALKNNHTISILFKAEQQEDKVPIWLVGDTDKKFIEYPLIRKSGGWNWGMSFNNSRAVTMMYYDRHNQTYYNWAKKFENQWTWVTLSYSKDKREVYFYINDELISQMNGVKENIPFPIVQELKSYDAFKPFLIGFCNHSNIRYKGKIAEVKIFDKFFDDINDVFNSKEGLLIDINSNSDIEMENITIYEENIKVIENIIPYRKEGRFTCLSHVDEGYVRGKWAKGETTAKNEKRFVTQMQQGLINYKEDGINNLEYEIKNVYCNNNVTIIDVAL